MKSTINAIEQRDTPMQIHATASAVRLSLRAVIPSTGAIFPIAFFDPKYTFLMPSMMAGCRNRPCNGATVRSCGKGGRIRRKGELENNSGKMQQKSTQDGDAGRGGKGRKGTYR